MHRGDYFGTLRDYGAAMQAQGIRLPQAPEDAFDPIWCAWGYGRGFTPDAGVRDAAGRQAARLRLGGAGRRLAGCARRLAAAGRQVSGRRRGHEGARRPHPRRGPQGPVVVGADGRGCGLAHGARASRLAAAQRRRIDAQDHVVGFAVPVSRRRGRARGCRRVRAQGAGRVGLRRPQDRRPAPQRRARVLQPVARPCQSRRCATKACPAFSKPSGRRRRP